jgi:hypothetical protein
LRRNLGATDPVRRRSLETERGEVIAGRSFGADPSPLRSDGKSGKPARARDVSPPSGSARIEFFADVFDQAFCAFLLSEAQATLASGDGFTHSNSNWPVNIVRASQPILVRNYDPALAAIILRQLIKRGVIDEPNFAVMNYAGSPSSYTPWHNDPMHEVAVTVFLNDVWDPDWGGIFLYKDDAGGVRGCTPKFNTCLRNAGHVPHATTMVTPDAASPRLTVQLFPKQP